MIALPIAELSARLLLPPPYPPSKTHVACEPVSGWAGPPNGVFEYATDGYYLHQVTWNSRGFRDLERSYRKDPGVFRVLLLGDSNLAGLDVEDSRTVRAVLEEILNVNAPPGQRFEVLAEAAPGWSPVQELAYFQEEGRRYQADLVVPLWYPGNDLHEMIPGRRFTSEEGVNCYSPFFVLCNGGLRREPVYAAPGFPSLWTACSGVRSALGTFLSVAYRRSRVYQIAEPQYFADPAPAPAIYVWTDTTRSNPTLSSLYQLTVAVYSELAKEASAAGAKTLFAIAPYREAVLFETDEAHRRRFVRETPALEHMQSRLPNQTFQKLMEAAGHSVADLHPDFVDAARERMLFWRDDIHCDPAGQQRMAELLARQLYTRGLVPIAPPSPDASLPLPRFVLHKDVSGWNLLGYDVDLPALVRNEATELRLLWLVPDDVEPETSPDFYRVKGRRWVQIVHGVRSLVRNGDFERDPLSLGFPYTLSGDKGEPTPVGDRRDERPTRVATLRATAEVPEVGFASFDIPVDPKRLYLLTGAMRSDDEVWGQLGAQWRPNGGSDYPLWFVAASGWVSHGWLVSPPEHAEAARIAVRTSHGAGTAYVDDIAFVDVGTLVPPCKNGGSGTRAHCGPPLLATPPKR